MKGKREEPKSSQRAPSPRKSAPLGDPFAEEPVRVEKPEKPDPGAWWRTCWDSGKGKILTAVLGCLAVFVIVVAVVLKMWIKAPELPGDPVTAPPQTTQNTKTDDPEPEEPAGPTDDELYPDDGYNGDMPTVSGDRKEGVYTFLLVGTDQDDGNTDTLMVVSYDTKEQDINIMSIPRDTMINEKWDIKKINSIYSRTGNSIDSLANRIQKLIGFKPDFYVKVELEMFVELVDLVDGVEFDVPQDMNYDDPWQDLHIHLKKGVQTLNGEDAMGLVRFRRYNEGDIQRVEVQQNFIKALIKECLSIKHWGKIKAYIDLAMKNVETDLDSGSVVWFAANVLGLNGTPALNMNDVYTCTLPGDYWGTAWSRDTQQEQSYVVIYPKQVVELVNERFNPYEQRVTTGMLDAMSILKNGDIASSTGSLRDTQHNAIMAVRRGEAYYDDNGKIVYGKPPAKPEQDENGNWYILDEEGTIIFTDEDGNPLDPVLPSPDGMGDPVDLSGTPSDGTPSTPGTSTPGTSTPGTSTPGTTPDPGQNATLPTDTVPGVPDGTEPPDPGLPPEEAPELPPVQDPEIPQLPSEDPEGNIMPDGI
ncbi:MAG: LCP family protein [Oscillospiraceae bacterium]|nr:LCP family protein [Oscillospiraceae bacterium]